MYTHTHIYNAEWNKGKKVPIHILKFSPYSFHLCDYEQPNSATVPCISTWIWGALLGHWWCLPREKAAVVEPLGWSSTSEGSRPAPLGFRPAHLAPWSPVPSRQSPQNPPARAAEGDRGGVGVRKTFHICRSDWRVFSICLCCSACGHAMCQDLKCYHQRK